LLLSYFRLTSLLKMNGQFILSFNRRWGHFRVARQTKPSLILVSVFTGRAIQSVKAKWQESFRKGVPFGPASLKTLPTVVKTLPTVVILMPFLVLSTQKVSNDREAQRLYQG
jgi:hypothetical protein